MIDLDRKKIRIGDVEHDILSFEVWFRTPAGLCNHLEIAREACIRDDLDPRLCIIPIPVAVGPNRIYEEMPRA